MIEQFEQILEKYNWPKRTIKPKTTIGEVESHINFKLPLDYKNFILIYSGFESHIGKEGVCLWDFDDIISINNSYGIIDNLPNTLGIGGNGGNEFIALEMTNENSLRVVLSPFIDLDKQYHIEIGSSFSDFLVRLEKGLQWFEKK